jgi:hypothetical protein
LLFFIVLLDLFDIGFGERSMGNGKHLIFPREQLTGKYQVRENNIVLFLIE